MESAYSIHIISFSIGIVIGALIMHYHSRAEKEDGRREGFNEAWRMAERENEQRRRETERSIDRETRVWQDRVHDLKNALHPDKLDKSSEARKARKRGGKDGRSDS